MNNTRRKRITALTKDVETLKAKIDEVITLTEDLNTKIENIRDEEQEYFDNMPESLQGGEKAERAEAAIAALESAIGACSSITETLQESINTIPDSLEEAVNV